MSRGLNGRCVRYLIGSNSLNRGIWGGYLRGLAPARLHNGREVQYLDIMRTNMQKETS